MPNTLTSSVFFFQAEDGIRDLYVTGVQTCALPILGPALSAANVEFVWAMAHRGTANRSEERRVGEECRSRGAPEHYKKIGKAAGREEDESVGSADAFEQKGGAEHGEQHVEGTASDC